LLALAHSLYRFGQSQPRPPVTHRQVGLIRDHDWTEFVRPAKCFAAKSLFADRVDWPLCSISPQVRSSHLKGMVVRTAAIPLMTVPSVDLARSYFVVSTTGMFAANCRLIRRSRRRSIWYHNAVFLAEMVFSNKGTYFERASVNCLSMAAALWMKRFA
jgi:hypothetical protein